MGEWRSQIRRQQKRVASFQYIPFSYESIKIVL
jgi:hypothetical protein